MNKTTRTTSDIPTLGSVIEAIRQTENLTFRELGERGKVSQSTLWDVMTGKIQPQNVALHTLSRIAHGLRLPPIIVVALATQIDPLTGLPLSQAGLDHIEAVCAHAIANAKPRAA